MQDVKTTWGRKAFSVLLAGAVASTGAVTIIGVQAAAPNGAVALAATYSDSDGIAYKVSGSKAKVSKCSGKATSAYIASKISFYTDEEMLNEKTATVSGIAAKAFKGSKVKTVIVMSSKFTKSSFKNALKGSKVTTVKVPKKCLKKYTKYLKKANSGKTVKVKVNSEYAAWAESIPMPIG